MCVSPEGRGMVRASEPDEGCKDSSLHPSPAAHLAMGVALSLRERDSHKIFPYSDSTE
jgi:hypothetical protein